MKHTMVRRNPDESFGASQIMFTPYEICELSEAPDCALMKSHCKLIVRDADDHSSRYYKGKLSDVGAVKCSGPAFQRACNFFGYKWSATSKGGTEDGPTLSDVMNLLLQFKSHSFKSESEFKRFLKDFRLEEFSTITARTGLCKKMCGHFVNSIRGCVPFELAFRKANTDYASWLCFLQGFFLPTTS